VLGLVFLSSGLAKLVPHFPNLIGPVWLEERLAPYGLALFARFIALSEVFAGSLLLTRRFPTLGALALLPILSCILMVTVSLQWRGTPFVNSVFLLLNLAILAYDYPKLRPLVADDDIARDCGSNPGSLRFDVAWIAILAFVLSGLALLPTGMFPKYALVLGGAALVTLAVIDWTRGRRAA
jgi:uncharacterized membrane protein YphA (DoxX/SURF4 family)